ncbi:MAG: C1 family peptidase [Lawsonella sp.]|nr:C1 family peptidase [Mycobacteriales bacterium]
MISADNLAAFQEDFASNPVNRLMQNAVTESPIKKVAMDRDIAVGIDKTVSHRLDDWKVSNQKKSGRCWLFAGLNTLRYEAAKKLNVKDFEFSQNYMLFWDKLEKSNYFLESMIDLADADADDRTVHHLLSDPIGDGGQWNMFVALINKYGAVPKSAMPETNSSSSTPSLNEALESLLRQGAQTLRQLVASLGGLVALDQKSNKEKVDAAKNDILNDIYRVLAIHLGNPPADFEWEWQDKDKNFTRKGRMTPQEFAAEYIDVNLSDYVCLVNDPRPSSEYGKKYTVDRLGNVVGGDPVIYLNAPIEVLKNAVKDIIVDGEPVWFGCDTNKQSSRELGIWDAKLFDYESAYDVEFTQSKADRLIYGDSLMTHAMVFVGVDVDDDGNARRFRVENSWGDKIADQGFFTMNAGWFDEYVFEVAVHKDRLPEDLRAAYESDEAPIVLPAWDPMGALA